jgi:hypothetical protein
MPCVRGLLGHPAVLIPVGLLILVVGVFVGLNAVGDHRTGQAADERRLCAESGSGVCFDVVEATIEPQVRGRRDIGREWDATAVDGGELKGFSVTHDDSDLLEEVGDQPVAIWVKPSDPTDPAAVELPDGTLVQSQWNGLRGVAAHVASGLLLIGIGVGVLITGLRRRGDRNAAFGSGYASPVILPSALGFLGVFLEVPPVVVAGFCVLAMLGGIVSVAVAVLRH